VTRPGGGAVMARRLWWRGRRAGGRQRVAGRVRTRARQEGVSGERAGEHSRPGIEHGGRQRLSAAAGARAACLNACARREGGSQRGRERGERKREWRERKESPLFDLAKTRNFQLKLEKF